MADKHTAQMRAEFEKWINRYPLWDRYKDSIEVKMSWAAGQAAYDTRLEADEEAVPVAKCGHSSTVEHRASNANVVGSNPIARSNSDAERLAEALRLLRSVLCDTDGNCCIRGTYEDRRTVDKALAMLAAQENPNG